MLKVQVKWNKDTYDVDVNTDESLDLFKAQLFELTHVTPDRQKILVRGKQIKSDLDLKNITDGAKIMMMGSAEPILTTAPKEKVVFEEDLTDSQKATLATDVVPSGIQNLGNTCYLNSSLQVMRAVPELSNAVKLYSVDETKLGSLLSEMDRTVNKVVPYAFVQTLRSEYPQFDQKSPEGGHMQQDADEALSQILFTVCERVGSGPEVPSGGVRSLFEGQMHDVISNTEDKEEASETKVTPFLKLRCHITNDTNYLSDGIRNGLKESIEKNSPKLGRNALYQIESRISELPPYLNVQFVRFLWRADTQKKAKILRKVTFPMRLDIFEFCSDELKKEISAYRDAVDKRFETEMDVDGEAEKKKTALECINSGVYELFGVVTHKGRYANSGHYIGWSKDPKSDDWFKFDDDVVTKVKSEEITALSGGGDWHMAYILFYRAAPWRTRK